MLEFLVELWRVFQFVEGAVDLDALEAVLQQFGEFLAVLPFPSTDDRGEQEEARAVRQLHGAVDHLADGLALDRQACGRRVGHTDAGPEQAHIVVDLGDRADGRARVAAGRLLLDRDGRREAFDALHVRLLHQLEELAGIGRQRFHIAALALGIDRVEGERGFAGARQARHHHKLTARDVHVDVLEIVFLGAAHADEGGFGHGRSGSLGRKDGKRFYRLSLGVLLREKNASAFGLSDRAFDMITNQTMAKTSMAATTKAVRVSGIY